MKRIRVYFLLIFRFLAISGCSHTDQSNKLTQDLSLNSKGDSVLFNSVRQARDLIGGLDTLENGYDSIQVRIWFGYAFSDTAQLFVLKKDIKEGWSGALLTLIYQRNEVDSSLNVKKQISKLTPESSWDNAIQKLKAFGVMTLPDSDRIENYPDDTDSDGITIEVATKTHYRVYAYYGVGIAQKTVPEARSVDEIQKFIQREFNFKKVRG
jgi:hypothetical protein